MAPLTLKHVSLLYGERYLGCRRLRKLKVGRREGRNRALEHDERPEYPLICR